MVHNNSTSQPSLRQVAFSFSQPLDQHKGLGPVACAALLGDDALVRSLVEAKAVLETLAPGMPEVSDIPGMTPIHLVLWFRSHDVKVLKTLLELRSDPNVSNINVGPPLGYCRTVEAVELLVKHGAGVNAQGKDPCKNLPLHVAVGFSAPPVVVRKLLDLHADVFGGRGGFANASPLTCLAYAGDSQDDLQNAQLLVEGKANINQVCKPEGTWLKV